MQSFIRKKSFRKLEKKTGTSSSKNVGNQKSHEKGIFSTFGYGKRSTMLAKCT